MTWLKDNVLWIALVILAVVIDESRVLRVNIIVVLVYYMGIRWKTRRAVLWAFVIGVLLDSIALKILGPNILSKGTLMFMAYFFQTGIFNLTPLLNGILCFAFTVIDNFIVYYSLTLFDTKPAEILYVAHTTLYQSIVNAVVGFIFIRERDE
ncbi:MAG: rod shape-determining protein MreD [Nitrospirae bacterium]|nr:rod shape-determining protein MreD [Nitrospirota bacterium]